MYTCISGWLYFVYHFWVTLTLTSDLVFRVIVSNHIISSHILFELGIPNLVCGCIVGWQSVMYQVLGHCDLDLFSRIIVSGVYLLYYLRLESQINLVYVCIFGWWYVADHLRSLWPIYDLVSRIIGSGAYSLYIIWGRNPKFGVWIPLGMTELCIPFWVTLTLTLTSGLNSRFFSYLFLYIK